METHRQANSVAILKYLPSDESFNPTALPKHYLVGVPYITYASTPAQVSNTSSCAPNQAGAQVLQSAEASQCRNVSDVRYGIPHREGDRQCRQSDLGSVRPPDHLERLIVAGSAASLVDEAAKMTDEREMMTLSYSALSMLSLIGGIAL